MDESGVGTAQAATLALLADTARAGRGGYFGGEGGYGFGTREAFNGTVENANIECNREFVINGENNRRFANVQQTITDLQQQISDCCCSTKQQIAESESKLTGLIKDTTIADLSAKLAECQASKNSSSIENIIVNCVQPLTAAVTALQNGNGGPPWGPPGQG